MKPPVPLVYPLLGIAVLAALGWGASRHLSGGACAVQVQAAPSAAAIPSSAVTHSGDATWAPEDVFRRAFWRHPTAHDQIVHAERREERTGDGSAVERWSWFIELHPSPELLAALRDPEVFGLLPQQPDVSTAAAVAARELTETPAWFPSETSERFEILRRPDGAFVALYDPAAQTLYAADAGHGFAAAQR